MVTQKALKEVMKKLASREKPSNNYTYRGRTK
jgi:hypothetical protein